jgi:glutaminase
MFSIQSMSKPITYAHAIAERGKDFMATKVNVEPAGGAFDTIEMDPLGRPFNPYINSGAIAVVMQLEGDMHQRERVYAETLSKFCGRKVTYDKGIYMSESSTAARNREIAEKLVETGVCEDQFDKENGLEAYFMICSEMVNTVDLAQLAATCANQGTNPVTKVQAADKDTIEEMMSVMMTCGKALCVACCQLAACDVVFLLSGYLEKCALCPRWLARHVQRSRQLDG